MSQKKILQKDSTVSRKFAYVLGNVSLNFTLRIDIKQELKDFIEILKTAQRDIEEELNKKN